MAGAEGWVCDREHNLLDPCPLMLPNARHKTEIGAREVLVNKANGVVLICQRHGQVDRHRGLAGLPAGVDIPGSAVAPAGCVVVGWQGKAGAERRM